ncbi:hypothetical protein DFH06DRAFT_1129935 [Mycena polygramma]|nr:hypothetical protein DFH06DRAFT_1129935 [Mycena polygramma]
MQGSEGAEASDEVPEEPKHLTNLSREATAKTEVNARMFGRVPMARAAEAETPGRNHRPERVREVKMVDGEYRRDGRGGKGNEAQNSKECPTEEEVDGRSRKGKGEPEGAEQFPAKGCCPEPKCTEPETESGTGPRVPRGRKLAKSSEYWWQREAPEVRIRKPGVSRAKVEEFGRRSDTSPEDPDKSRRVECSRRTRNPEVDRAKLRSNHIPTEIFGDIRICGGFKAVTQPTSCSNTPEVFGTKAEPRPRVPRGMCREGEGNGNGKHRRCRPKTGGDVDRRDDKSPEDADKMSGGGTVRKQGPKAGQSSGVMQQGRSDHIPTEIFGDIRICGGPKAVTQPANCSSTREMFGTKGTETECSEGNFAKSCEGNRRRAPKIAGGANQGLEGSTERGSRLIGASEMQGRKVTEIRENWRKVTQVRKNRKRVGLLIEEPGPGEDVWDFGKDVRDPERPESFSGASLGNRKSQNTIRTGVRGARAGKKIVDRKDLVTTLRSFAQRSNSDGVVGIRDPAKSWDPTEDEISKRSQSIRR